LTYLRSPISIHVGFVLHSNPSIFLPPNMTLGIGCCGRSAPAGSEGPGTRLTGRDEESRSVRRVESVLVGCACLPLACADEKRFWRQLTSGEMKLTGMRSSVPFLGAARVLPAQMRRAILAPSIWS